MLKKEIEQIDRNIKKEIIDELNATMEKRLQEYEKRINEFNESTNAKAFHLQGNLQREKEQFQSALGDYMVAANSYYNCDDFQNLQTTLRLIDECISDLALEEINDLKIISNHDLDSLLSKMQEGDEKGMLTHLVRDIRLKLSKLPKTIKDKQVQSQPTQAK